MGVFCKCPRCGDRAFEKMTSYYYCVNCQYFEDYYVGHDSLLYEAILAEREMLRQYAEEEVAAEEDDETDDDLGTAA